MVESARSDSRLLCPGDGQRHRLNRSSPAQLLHRVHRATAHRGGGLCGFGGAEPVAAYRTPVSHGRRFLRHPPVLRVLHIRGRHRCARLPAGTLSGWWTTAVVLLVVAAISWLALGYLVPVFAVLGKAERPIIKGANGSWFVWVVGAQSVAVLAATLEPVLAGSRDILAITAVFAWSIGLVLYVAVAVFVALRMMSYPLDPREFNPSYWVSMGALAITVVAAARIAEMAPSPMVDATRGLVVGLAVLFWCFATWMIPALFGIGIWRHMIAKVPLVYEPGLWSIVFPLGMYSVAGIYLGRVNDLPIVEAVGTAWMWVAVTSWIITFAAMLRAIVLRISHRRWKKEYS